MPLRERIETWASVLALALVAMLASASPARAQEAQAGRDAYLAADFPTALRGFESVIASGRALLADALDAHRHLATLHFALGDAAVAEQHARAAVALAPDAQPVEGSPVEVASMFDAARVEASGLQLATEPALVGEGSRVSAWIAPWPSALRAWLSLSCRGNRAGDAWTARARVPRVTLDLPALRTDVRCVAELVPSVDAAWWLRGERVLAAGPREEAPPSGPAGDEIAWGVGIAGGALAVIGVVVLVFVLAQDTSRASFGDVRVDGW